MKTSSRKSILKRKIAELKQKKQDNLHKRMKSKTDLCTNQIPTSKISVNFNKSRNGQIVDPDSFINLFLSISFTAGEVVSLRRTCVWWKHMLQSNAIWKIFFQKDFGPSSARWQELNQKFQVQNGKQESFWYSEYMTVLHHIPRVIPLPDEFKHERQEEDEKDKDADAEFDDQEMHTRSIDFTYMRLELPQDEKAGYQIHKLAVILSILATNQYFPKTHSKQTEMVKVGVSSQPEPIYAWNRRPSPERVKLIPLLHFCYAVLCGEEERIFTLEDYNRIKELHPIQKEQPRKKKTSKGTHKQQGEAFIEEKDFIGVDNEPIFQVAKQIPPPKKTYDDCYEQFTSYWGEQKTTRFIEEPHIGISPNVDGPFKPFVFYLKVRGVELHQHEYRWKTDEVGWAPGFFNASFGWFYHLTMDSLYDCHDQSITVKKVSAREVIN